MEQALISLLHQDLDALGLPLDPGVDALCLKFLDKVLEVNQVMNLTAITDPSEAIHKHLVDSLSVLLLKSLKNPESPSTPLWTDIGSGAGFPGMVLGLAVPQATLHLVESTVKKAHFLNQTIAEFGLMKRILVHAQRAELLTPWVPSARSVPRGTASGWRGLSDAVFFRGVSKLASLVELGAPFLKLNGLLVAYKGPKAQEELKEAGRAMKELKFELLENPTFTLPGTTELRTLLCLRKTGETPKRYPRLVGLAQKQPLL